MACFYPLQGFRKRGGGWTPNVVQASIPEAPIKLQVPCGQCVGCRLERSRQWAVRCVHEASLWESNCFVTLTYNDAFIPIDRSLDHRHFQLFMKRLRKHFGASVRFYMCGEYGEEFGRPHFHVLLFNCDFIDKRCHTLRHGKMTFTSALLSRLWPYGFHEIGDVTFQSAGYVARYVMKKVTGHFSDDYYEWVDPVSGECFRRKPEYNCMSRRPGIAKGWLDKFIGDVYPSDFLVVNGVRMKPPRYYDYHFELLSPDEAEAIKLRRRKLARFRSEDSTPERLHDREVCAIANLSRVSRSLA